jgi:hypothetical protein
MKQLAHLLVLLLISAQVDDAWAVAPVLPSAPLSDENDEYLPAQRQLQGAASVSRQTPAFNHLKTRAADFAPVRSRVPSEWNLTTPLAPPSLYVFMSLQI